MALYRIDYKIIKAIAGTHFLNPSDVYVNSLRAEGICFEHALSNLFPNDEDPEGMIIIEYWEEL